MHLLQAVIFGIFYAGILSERIEMTQTPKKSNIKILSGKVPKALYLDETTSTVSPQWIDYQRERFSNSQKLIVISEKNLKNSAKEDAPASVQYEYDSQMQNQRTPQTKTQMDVTQQSKPNIKSNGSIQKEQVDTTSRHGILYNEKMPIKNTYRQQPQRKQGEVVEEAVVEDVNDANEEYENNDDNSSDTNSDSRLQFPSIQGFFKFLKSIQKTWIKRSGFGIEEKINLLKNLKDNLMRRIEQQFAMIWQPRDAVSRRRKRGLLDQSNLNFPPEAALMSINFLTFAVFLIKLVLQVVHIIKSKHYSFTGFGANAEAYSKATIRN